MLLRNGTYLPNFGSRGRDRGTLTYDEHFQTSSDRTVRPLTEDKLIQIDRDDQGFRCGMAVRLAREDSSLRRKDDARELPEIGDVVCGRRTATDVDVVVVPLQQSSVTEVQCLLCTVGRDIRGIADFQTTPRFACFLPRRDFFRFNAGSDKEKRSI